MDGEVGMHIIKMLHIYEIQRINKNLKNISPVGNCQGARAGLRFALKHGA